MNYGFRYKYIHIKYDIIRENSRFYAELDKRDSREDGGSKNRIPPVRGVKNFFKQTYAKGKQQWKETGEKWQDQKNITKGVDEMQYYSGTPTLSPEEIQKQEEIKKQKAILRSELDTAKSNYLTNIYQFAIKRCEEYFARNGHGLSEDEKKQKAINRAGEFMKMYAQEYQNLTPTDVDNRMRTDWKIFIDGIKAQKKNKNFPVAYTAGVVSSENGDTQPTITGDPAPSGVSGVNDTFSLLGKKDDAIAYQSTLAPAGFLGEGGDTKLTVVSSDSANNMSVPDDDEEDSDWSEEDAKKIASYGEAYQSLINENQQLYSDFPDFDDESPVEISGIQDTKTQPITLDGPEETMTLAGLDSKSLDSLSDLSGTSIKLDDESFFTYNNGLIRLSDPTLEWKVNTKEDFEEFTEMVKSPFGKEFLSLGQSSVRSLMKEFENKEQFLRLDMTRKMEYIFILLFNSLNPEEKKSMNFIDGNTSTLPSKELFLDEGKLRKFLEQLHQNNLYNISTGNFRFFALKGFLSDKI